ncbi:hypothetical protein EDD11_004256 [Mortierella claussenii]|nr:hypothetical protein EDD11_004256 [Mortierella claussenii]
MGAILEKAGIPYEIFEKASTLKPIGSAFMLGPGMVPLFKQLGVLDQIESRSLAMKHGTMFNQRLEVIARFFLTTKQDTVNSECPQTWSEELQDTSCFGWPLHIISRSVLHDILLSLVPSHKIHLNARIISHEESEEGHITIHISHQGQHTGHILVGADGAYSRVRESLYQQMDKEQQQRQPQSGTRNQLLPVSDMEPLGCSSIALIQTFTTAAKTVCWILYEVLDKSTSRVDKAYTASEWGPQGTEAMCQQVRHLLLRPSMTMGDLIDLCPKENILKVMLEEKIFETWAHGRTVLLGDGAQSAIFDAIVLANYINTIQSNNQSEVERALQAYKDERFGHSKEAGLAGNLLRLALTSLPQWILNKLNAKLGGYRPQVAFLPRVVDEARYRPIHQPSLETARPEPLDQSAAKA